MQGGIERGSKSSVAGECVASARTRCTNSLSLLSLERWHLECHPRRDDCVERTLSWSGRPVGNNLVERTTTGRAWV